MGGGLALLFALVQLGRVLPLPEGGSPAQGLATALRKGTNAYLKWQLLLSLGALVLVSGLLEVLALLQLWDWLSPLALLSGGLCGLLVGVAGARLTALAGPRAAQAAEQRLDRGVNAAFNAGSVVSFLAVGLVLLHLTLWFFLLRYLLGYDSETIARTLFFLGLGGALASLLLRMGSVFARGASLAAETVDREMGLPPDDPKNPAAIADQVGHGVGTAAEMGADLYSTWELLLLAALYLGQTVFSPADMAWNAMLLPLAAASAGAFTGLLGFLTVQLRERGDRYSLPWSLRLSTLAAALLAAAAYLPITYFLMGSWKLYPSLLAGLAAGFLIPLCGEYFTSDTYKPARSLADAAEEGVPSAVTGALGKGLCAAALPLLLAVAALAAAFWTAGGWSDFNRGAYGVALAGIGLLSPSGVSLAAALCGSIGDCAAHAAALTDAEEAARRRADNLAAIGASAASGGRCLAAASTLFAALPCLLLLCFAGTLTLDSLPLLGALLGCALLPLFLGLLLLAVRRSARAVLLRAREQFRDNEELISGDQAPDYAACVGRCATRSLLGAIPPALLALLLPPALGIPLGLLGLAGASALAGLSGVLLFLGVTLSLLLSLTGGVLSGARRYVESGRKGGRGSHCHRSLLTAERALAPLCQAAGPALPALVRLTLFLSCACPALLAGLFALLG